MGLPNNSIARAIGVDTHYMGEVPTSNGIILPPPGPPPDIPGAWDVTNMVFVDHTTMPVGVEAQYMVYLDNSGTFVFWSGRDTPSSGGWILHRITLATPWDIATKIDATLQTKVMSGVCYAFAVSEDGSILLAVNGSNTIERYDMSIVFDLDTTLLVDSNTLGLVGATLTGCTVSPLGDKLHIATLDSGNSFVQGYTLNNFTLNTLQLTVGDRTDLNLFGGRRIWGHYIRYDTGGRIYNAPQSSNLIEQADMSPPFGLSTAISSGQFAAHTSTHQGIFWKPDGTKVFLSGAGSEIMDQYNVSL